MTPGLVGWGISLAREAVLMLATRGDAMGSQAASADNTVVGVALHMVVVPASPRPLPPHPYVGIVIGEVGVHHRQPVSFVGIESAFLMCCSA